MKEEIQRYLDKYLISQSKFAKLAGVDASTLWGIMKGKKKTSRLTALKIEKATNGEVPISVFGFEK